MRRRGPSKTPPKYRKHKRSGQAIVTLDGKDFYLGPHGTKASKSNYDRLIGEWLANGRRIPDEPSATVTVTELMAAYWRFCKTYYVKNGNPTGEQAGIKAAIRHLKTDYGKVAADEFRPLALESIRERMIRRGNSRGYINQNIGRIRRMFRWGGARQLVSVEVYQALLAVDGLRRGKSQTKERLPVLPVDIEVVELTLPHCRKVIADMIRIQLLTGARPGEICKMRPVDIDRSNDVWGFRFAHHKMEHRDRTRVVFIGPRAQKILVPYLLRDADKYCFLNRNGKPFANSYREAIYRACDKAGVERWAPNRLRHSRGTEIRSKFGLEASQVVLGHAQADTTQIYAERDFAKAAEIMRAVG